MRNQSSRRVGAASTSKWTLALALATAMSIWMSAPGAAATAVLDQQQTVASVSPLLTKAMAQTFTAGMTGGLDHVSLQFGPTSTATGWVEIRNVGATGMPTGTALGTAADRVSFASSTFSAPFYNFQFPSPISLTAGTRYAIVVIISLGTRSWSGAGLDLYARGQGWIASCGTCAWFATTTPKDFTFQTWMITNVNQAPVIAADSSTVTVNEGTAPHNTGTFSDPDGDTVTITASAGNVTRSGVSSGTWTWTQPASDEGLPQAVNISADDGNGLNTTTTFTVTVVGVAPTASIGSATWSAADLSSSGPVTSPEGTAVSLVASASSPDAADNAGVFTYSWSVTKNGAAFGAGTGSAFSFTPDDEGTFVATVKATDDGGMTGVASVTIAGGNVAPTVQIFGITQSSALILPNESLTFGGSFFDPGALDSHTATWDFGDGATSTTAYGPGSTAYPSAVHAYTAAGTFAATLTVTDDDGGVGQAAIKVTVMTPQDALSWISNHLVAAIPTLNAGQKTSLNAKLNAASASITRGDITAANNQLNAFLFELQAYLQAGKVSSAEVATLTTDIHAVQAALGTFNRFLDWWPLEA